MGYAMAMNLRRKSQGRLTVFDLNTAAVERFCEEAQGLGDVVVATSAAEVVAACVSAVPSC